MSTDYEAVCHECKAARHLGQRMGPMRYSFAYGFPQDRVHEAAFMLSLREEQHQILAWIAEHLEQGHRVEIATDFPEEYEWEP